MPFGRFYFPWTEPKMSNYSFKHIKLPSQRLKEPVWNLTRTLLTLRFCSLLTGQSWCARLTDAFAFISIHENHSIVSAGLAVAGVTLRQVLLYGPAKVELLHPGTLNLLYQLWQWPQLPKQEWGYKIQTEERYKVVLFNKMACLNAYKVNPTLSNI